MGNMPSYTAPYADHSLLEAVMDFLPGGAEGSNSLFAVVTWQLLGLSGLVLTAVNAFRRDSEIFPWDDFLACGLTATAHY